MNTNRMRGNGSLVVGTAIALFALVPTGVALAASAGTCVTGIVPVSFVLPDGSIHPAGEFTACADRRLSPVQSLQRVSVEGSTQGLFVATETSAEANAVRPYLTFLRVENDEWILVGITLPGSGNREPSRTLRFADQHRVAELAAASALRDLLEGGSSDEPSQVIVAARLR